MPLVDQQLFIINDSNFKSQNFCARSWQSVISINNFQFDPLLVESKQAATVVLMLDSPEEDVLAKACEAIYKFVDKCRYHCCKFIVNSFISSNSSLLNQITSQSYNYQVESLSVMCWLVLFLPVNPLIDQSSWKFFNDMLLDLVSRWWEPKADVGFGYCWEASEVDSDWGSYHQAECLHGTGCNGSTSWVTNVVMVAV